MVPAATSVALLGSNPPAFSTGESVVLEWSCQPKISYLYTYCDSFLGGCDSHERWSFHDYYQSGSNGGGQYGVGSTAGPTAGSRTMTVSSNGTVTLSCSGSVGTGQISLSYTATASTPTPTPTPDSCPTAIESAGEGFVLYSGATRKINKYGITYCVTSYDARNIFIPAKTAAELQSFTNASPPSVTKF